MWTPHKYSWSGWFDTRLGNCNYDSLKAKTYQHSLQTTLTKIMEHNYNKQEQKLTPKLEVEVVHAKTNIFKV